MPRFSGNRGIMIRELDTVVLIKDLIEYGLEEGDVGAVVHVYEKEAAYEVEFVAADGTTVAVLSLDRQALRPVGGREILHVRERCEATSRPSKRRGTIWKR